MKVFCYIGSLHEESNTERLIYSLIDCINSKGINTINDIFIARNTNIHMCKGCSYCFFYGICKLDDEFEKVHKKMLQADLIILASPVYLHNISGSMKNFIDRCTKGIYIFELRGKIAITVSASGSNGNKFVNYYLHQVINKLGAFVIDDLAYTNLMKQETIEDINNRCSEKILNTMKTNMIITEESQEKRYTECKSMASKFADEYWIKNYWIQHGFFEYNSYLDLVYSSKI